MKGRGLISSCDHTKDTHCCRFLWINCQNDIQWLSNVCWCEMGLVNEGNYIRLTNKFQFPRSVCCEHSIWRTCQETQINIIRTFLFCCIWEASPSPSYEILHDFSSSLYRLRVWSLTLIIIHTHKRTDVQTVQAFTQVQNGNPTQISQELQHNRTVKHSHIQATTHPSQNEQSASFFKDGTEITPFWDGKTKQKPQPSYDF